jgi:hypothetical protein
MAVRARRIVRLAANFHQPQAFNKGAQITVNITFRRILLASALVIVCALGCSFAQNKFGQPKTVLHIVTVKWKAESTAAQQQAAIDGVKTMAAAIPGIKNIWVKKIKVQPADYNTLFVIEFNDEAALTAYADHPAHKKWEEIYLPIRDRSTSHDVTN